MTGSDRGQLLLRTISSHLGGRPGAGSGKLQYVDIARGTSRENGWLNTVAYPDEFVHWINAFNRCTRAARRLGLSIYSLTLASATISIQPRGNLISNLGFRADATHTSGSNNVADLSPPGRGVSAAPAATNFLADDIYMREHCYRKKELARQPIIIAAVFDARHAAWRDCAYPSESFYVAIAQARRDMLSGATCPCPCKGLQRR